MFFLLYPPPPLHFYMSRMGRRPRTRRRHSGRRNFKPKIPSESEDTYLRKLSGNYSAGLGRLQGRSKHFQIIRTSELVRTRLRNAEGEMVKSAGLGISLHARQDRFSSKNKPYRPIEYFEMRRPSSFFLHARQFSLLYNRGEQPFGTCLPCAIMRL